jgi:hypothetical protein
MKKISLTLIVPDYIRQVDIISALAKILERYHFIGESSNTHIIEAVDGEKGEFVIITT